MTRKRLTPVILFIGLTFLSFFAPTVTHAQTISGRASFDAAQMQEYYSATRDCANPSLECLVFHVTRYIAIELSRSIGTETNVDPGITTPPGGNQIPDDSQVPSLTPVANRPASFMNGMGFAIGAMYDNPVANTQTYVADILNSAHISTPVYAQGVGFASLDPVLDLWKTFRNVAYMFFVILFIVIGFMIMFRAKISGQAVVTAQQAIPSIIISLILVTFSYAIGGFMIDLMYLFMFMIVGLFGQTFTNNPDIVNYNILEIAGVLFGATTNLSNNIDVATNIVSSLIGNELSAAVTGLGLAGGVTMSLVLAIVVLIGTFKLFFELLKSYASIVVSIVTSPVVLMMGAIPGKNPFWPWLWDLLGNLSAFPTVLLVIVLFYEFTSAASGIDGGFMPPFLLARGQTGAIATLMGLALIIALPEIVKEVKKMVGAKDGIGTQIFGWAKANVQEAWRGNKYIPGASTPFKYAGRAAKSAGKFAGRTAWAGTKFAAASGAAAAGGSLVGGAYGAVSAARQGRDLRTILGQGASGAVKGGVIGGLAPAAIKIVPKIVKVADKIGGSTNNIMRAGVAATNAFDAVEALVGSRRGTVGQQSGTTNTNVPNAPSATRQPPTP